MSPNSTPQLLSGIYASPRFVECFDLWNNLIETAHILQRPWFYLGDFNELLSSADKKRGNPINRTRTSLFRDCLDQCNLLDLGFAGSKFTWSYYRQHMGFFFEHLNRAFCNPFWQQLHPKARVFHLSHTHSDHCPILLDLAPTPLSNLPRPFCEFVVVSFGLSGCC